MLAKMLKTTLGIPEEVVGEIFSNPAKAIASLFKVKTDPEKYPEMELKEGEAKIISCHYTHEDREMVLIAAVDNKFNIVRKIMLYDLAESIKPPKNEQRETEPRAETDR